MKQNSTFSALIKLVIFFAAQVAVADPLVNAFIKDAFKLEMTDLSTIQVGTSTFPFAVTDAEKLPLLSSWVLEKLRSCPSPCEVKLGNKNSFLLQTPPLGEGERGVVFRVLGSEKSHVLKISKPELKSFAILRAESTSHRFWTEHHTMNYSVPDRLHTHASGLFSVMQEVQGEPLTHAFFRLGLLQVNPLDGDIIVNPNFKHVPSKDLKKIWSTVQDLITTVNANPSMRTSLSPNNIFVTWDSAGRISKTSLIDFGIDGTGDPRYFKLKNFKEYLELSALKIKGYLSKPGFVSSDLFRLQEGSRLHYGLPFLFDEKAYRPLLEEVAQKLLPGQSVTGLTLKEILDLKIPTHLATMMQIENATFTRPTTVNGLAQTAIALNDAIARATGTTMTIKLDGVSYTLKLPALGQGDRGIVYALEGTEEVIKIPKGNLASVLTLMNESVGYSFWYKQSLQSKKVFSVPERRLLHPLGLFSVMKRDNGEPLTNMMVRFGLLTFDPETKKATQHLERIADFGTANKLKVEKALLGILEIIRNNPAYGLSVSPNNLHVNYADAAKTIISDVVLIDVGLGNRNASKFEGIKDLASYIDLSCNRLEKYLKVGYVDSKLQILNQNATVKSTEVMCSRIFGS